MKSLRLIALLASVLFLSGCKTLMFDDNVMKVVEGMQLNEVKEMLGTPQHRRFDNGIEEWEYIQNYTDGSNKTVIIGFTDGRVSAMDSFGKASSKDSAPPRKGKAPRAGEKTSQTLEKTIRTRKTLVLFLYYTKEQKYKQLIS